MKYLIISDSHGYLDNLKTILQSVGKIEGIFHLGDLQCSPGEIEVLAGCPVYAVSGNNDFRAELPAQRVVDLEGHRFFMTHGHREGVSFGGIMRLVYRAEELGADVAMYGHTHRPDLQQEDGITIINPGSISLPRQENRKPTYAIMTIDADGEIGFGMYELD